MLSQQYQSSNKSINSKYNFASSYYQQKLSDIIKLLQIMRLGHNIKIIIFIIVIFINMYQAVPILGNQPITFQMNGLISYIPDAGGAQQPGYKLKIGFTAYSWIGVLFMSSSIKQDFLVVQISDFYTDNGGSFKGHLVSYSDYFLSDKTLKADTITNLDISSFTYSNQKSYSLDITRNMQSNSAEDWDGNAKKYSVQSICFYTSPNSFDISTYNKHLSTCVNFQINNCVSTFVGPYLKKFYLNGYVTNIYGYIDGPVLSNKLFFYQQTALFAYVQVPAIVIEIGTTENRLGQDFYSYSPILSQNGDYYGASINQKQMDNQASGFQNPALTLQHWNCNPATQIADLGLSALRISFDRQVYTHDKYDKSMLSTFLFCMYIYSSGSINGALSDKSCEIVELSLSFSQLSTFKYQIYLTIGLAILVFMLIQI